MARICLQGMHSVAISPTVALTLGGPTRPLSLVCYTCTPRAPPPPSAPSPLLQIDGPLVGRQDIPKLAFIKTSFKDAIKGSLVEPRRAAISLDYNYRVQQVRARSV